MASGDDPNASIVTGKNASHRTELLSGDVWHPALILPFGRQTAFVKLRREL